MKIISSCPLDQIIIIMLQCCPYLRSYLTAIIAEIWKKKVISPTWTKAITILIHKKGSTDNPGNFRPLILKTVTLKILTNSQKDFVHGILSTFEHISDLAYVINNARKGQRSLIVTFLDLCNAFGEVYHNLIVF